MGSITPYETAKGRRYMVQFRKATGEWIDASAARITIDELGIG